MQFSVPFLLFSSFELLALASLLVADPTLAAPTAPVSTNINNASALDNSTLQGFGSLLTTTFFTLLQVAGGPNGTNSTAKAAVMDFLDPAFQFQRPDGQEGGDKTHYVPPKISSFAISDLITTAPEASVVVVRYNVTASEETASSGSLGSLKSARLSVFHFNGNANATSSPPSNAQQLDGWKLISHASFNPPATTYCLVGVNSPVTPNEQTGPDASANLALANLLLDNWFSALANGTGQLYLDSQVQVQQAIGAGSYTGAANYVVPVIDSYSINHTTATRNGRVLVARYDDRTNQSIGGVQGGGTVTPRLTTFLLKSADVPEVVADWKVVAHASYNLPANKSLVAQCMEQPADGKIGRGARSSVATFVALAAAIVVGVL